MMRTPSSLKSAIVGVFDRFHQPRGWIAAMQILSPIVMHARNDWPYEPFFPNLLDCLRNRPLAAADRSILAGQSCFRK